jgi:protein arginine kinase activator
MQCEICKNKTATVHLTEIVDGHRTETHLCQNCAQKEGITVKSQLSLNELLSSLIAAHQQSDESAVENAGKVCDQCGMTMDMFRKQALLGCPDDYKVFEDELRDLIEKTQDNNSLHIGKTPPLTSVKAEPEKKDTVKDLQRRLELAVKTEDYELAAKLRDQLKALS